MSNIVYTLIKIRDKEKPRMTEEQIKQVRKTRNFENND